MGISWKNLGLALEFNYDQIQAIERDSHFKTQESCLNLLHRWLNGEACQPISWERLLEALREVELPALATELEQLLSS